MCGCGLDLLGMRRGEKVLRYVVSAVMIFWVYVGGIYKLAQQLSDSGVESCSGNNNTLTL